MAKISTSSVAGAVMAVVNAAYAALLTFDLLHFTDVQKGAMLLAANATVGLVLAAWAHLRPGTVGEPVAVGVAFLAWTSAVLALFVVFGCWGLTAARASAIQTLVVLIVGFPTAVLVRQQVSAPETVDIAVETARAEAVTPQALMAAFEPKAP